ncbi:unnamed protein product [Polarella glacialis]|uniref:Protein kinase domain-containing protein n=1 Tax=Polarella glacialis TaxID=89957 RepID=A0A813L5L6_POLGL|nr:unnamed protein product [Polarella glacialis]CAE8721102.1 unnamed protein product [Polarella glacialis]
MIGVERKMSGRMSGRNVYDGYGSVWILPSPEILIFQGECGDVDTQEDDLGWQEEIEEHDPAWQELSWLGELEFERELRRHRGRSLRRAPRAESKPKPNVRRFSKQRERRTQQALRWERAEKTAWLEQQQHQPDDGSNRVRTRRFRVSSSSDDEGDEDESEETEELQGVKAMEEKEYMLDILWSRELHKLEKHLRIFHGCDMLPCIDSSCTSRSEIHDAEPAQSLVSLHYRLEGIRGKQVHGEALLWEFVPHALWRLEDSVLRCPRRVTSLYLGNYFRERDYSQKVLHTAQKDIRKAAGLHPGVSDLDAQRALLQGACSRRDTARFQHVKILRQILSQILRVVCQAGGEEKSRASHPGFDTALVHLVNTLDIIRGDCDTMKQRLDEARQCLNQPRMLNSRHVTPESATCFPAQREIFLSGIVRWKREESGKEFRDMTEVAAARLRSAIGCANLFQVAERSDALGSDRVCQNRLNRLLSTSRQLEEAIRLEETFWSTTPLTTFPGRELIEAAEQGVKVLDNKVKCTTAMLQFCKEALTELQTEEAALQQTGYRDDLVAALHQATVQHKAAMRYLRRLEMNMAEAREDTMTVFVLPPPDCRSVSIQEAQNYLDKAVENVRRCMLEVQRAIFSLAQIECFFPEVVQYLKVGLPRELIQLWRGSRDRQTFSLFELICKSRSCVYKVAVGDEVFAAKQYQVGSGPGSVDLDIFFREAALLNRMRHPHIIPITGIFHELGHDSFYYIMMPFCENGSLLQWLMNCKPTELSLRRALAGVLQALVHLHAHDVVHGDCKPENILIGNDGRSLLADFDIAVDCSSRRTASYQQQRITQAVAFTLGFNAPELVRCGSSKSTDIFAFGRTIASAYDQVDGGMPDDALQLVDHLTRDDPAARSSAEESLGSQYFGQVFSWERQERRSCAISLEECSLADGLECSNLEQRHFLSNESLAAFVGAEVVADLGKRRQLEGKIVCPVPGCSAPFCDADLASALCVESFASYLKSRIDLVEHRLNEEMEQEMQTRISNELARIRELDGQVRKVQDACRKVEEELLVLRCPRCRHAFIDFNGCWALTCSHCSAGFCGWCLVDCGRDAHAHVRQECPEGRDLFPAGGFAVFEHHHGNRRGRLLKAYLETLDSDTRRGVLLEVRLQLQDVVPDGLIRRLLHQSDLI